MLAKVVILLLLTKEHVLQQTRNPVLFLVVEGVGFRSD
jgi:hypothetical protein